MKRVHWSIWAVLIVIALTVWMVQCVKADTRVDLLAILNAYIGDTGNNKMSEANKILMMDATGRELGRSYVYTKLDTVLTVANTESYALNTDFAGALRSVHIKKGSSRSYVSVGSPNNIPNAADPNPGEVLYAYLGADARLVVEAIPLYAETLIVSYYALPVVLSASGTEWDLPDEYEDAAIRITAAKVLWALPTAWAIERANVFYQSGWADVERLKNAAPLTRQVGDADNP